ncbi:MAG: ribonuclease P protein component [Phycisphaerales bacterium]
MRLRHAREFSSVFDAGCRKPSGPLVLYSKPNDRRHPRLGLSVGRRVGGAVARNQIKRRLREAFRHMQHNWSIPLDLVVAVRPHRPLSSADYSRLLEQAWRRAHAEWEKRERRARSGGESP